MCYASSQSKSVSIPLQWPTELRNIYRLSHHFKFETIQSETCTWTCLFTVHINLPTFPDSSTIPRERQREKEKKSESVTSAILGTLKWACLNVFLFLYNIKKNIQISSISWNGDFFCKHISLQQLHTFLECLTDELLYSYRKDKIWKKTWQKKKNKRINLNHHLVAGAPGRAAVRNEEDNQHWSGSSIQQCCSVMWYV